jgi:predicted membrane-bound spermidine synthase
MLDETKRWIRNVWYGKLDAVLLGWLIGVFIAILNEIFNRYGEDIKANVSRIVNKNWSGEL